MHFNHWKLLALVGFLFVSVNSQTVFASEEFSLENYLSGENIDSGSLIDSSKFEVAKQKVSESSLRRLDKSLRQAVKLLEQALTNNEEVPLSELQGARTKLNSSYGLYRKFLDNQFLLAEEHQLSNEKLSALQLHTETIDNYYADLLEQINAYIEALESRSENSENIFLVIFYYLVEKYEAFFLEYDLNGIRTKLDSLPVQILRADYAPYSSAVFTTRSLPDVEQGSITPSYKKTVLEQSIANDLAPLQHITMQESILEQAAFLDHNPVAIYEFVRNEIKPAWYPGAMKNDATVLLHRSGNDVDQATLLIALLRASGIPSRYVTGVIEVPAPEMISLLGVSDAEAAKKALSASLRPFESIIRGGRVDAFKLEYVWVSALVPYGNYRGTQIDESESLWIPLAPAFASWSFSGSQSQWHEQFNLLGFIAEYLQSEQTNLPLEKMVNEAEQWLGNNEPDLKWENLFSKRTTTTVSDAYLPSSLPFNVLAVQHEDALLDGHDFKVSFLLADTPDGFAQTPTQSLSLSTQVSLSALLNQRVTVSYQPATKADHDVMLAYGGLDKTPSYLIRLRPVIKVNGVTLAVGEGIVAPGESLYLRIKVALGENKIKTDKVLVVGSYHAIAFGADKTVRINQGAFPEDTEYKAAQLLSQAALHYQENWSTSEEKIESLFGISFFRAFPSITFSSNALQIDRLIDEPVIVKWKGVTLDAVARHSVGIPNTFTPDLRAIASLNALEGSALEHRIYQDDFFVKTISSEKAIGIAQDGGQQLLEINKTNLENQLNALLDYPNQIKENIRNWVNQGFTVKAPQGSVSYLYWAGFAWFAQDEFGNAAYLISDGLAGAESAGDFIIHTIEDALKSPYSKEKNYNTSDAFFIFKVPSTDFQNVVVDKDSKKVSVLVLDNQGSPIIGKEVVFSVEVGDGLLRETDSARGSEESVISTLTDEEGIASFIFRAGKSTDSNYAFVKLDQDDEFETKVMRNRISAAMTFNSGYKSIDNPFTIFTIPDVPVNISISNNGVRNGGALSYAGPLGFHVVDQFGNWISNEEVIASADLLDENQGEVFSNESNCSKYPPMFGDCGGDKSITLVSNGFTLGSSVGVILGNKIGTYQYSIKLSSNSQIIRSFTIEATNNHKVSLVPFEEGDSDTVLEAKTAHWVKAFDYGFGIYDLDLIKAGEIYPVDSEDIPEEYRRALKIAVYNTPVDDNGVYSSQPPNSSFVNQFIQTLQVTNGGSIVKAEYSTENQTIYVSIRTGVEPGWNQIIVQEPEENSPRALLQDILGLTFEIDDTLSQAAVLDGNERVVSPFIFTQELLIASALYPDAIFRTYDKDSGEFIESKWLPNLHVGGISTQKIFEKNQVVDSSRNYEGEFVINNYSYTGVIFDRFDIDIKPTLFKTVVYPGGGYSVDESTQWVCGRVRDKVGVFLNHEGRISVYVDGVMVGSERVLDKGYHEIDVSDQVSEPGYYNIEVRGISSITQAQEIKKNTIRVNLKMYASPSVGRTHVKGVDIWDGKLILSEQEANIAGRGPGIDFNRSYSSFSDNESLMGLGWNASNNYALSVSPCTSTTSVVTVNSGVGASKFLASVGGEPPYIPAQGNHGTLIKEGNDWNFFAKDGTAYHFGKSSFDISESIWRLEYISDTNSNNIYFNYQAGKEIDEGSARIALVKDGMNRELEFNYESIETKRFGEDYITAIASSLPSEEEDAGKVIRERLVSIVGPGISFNYEYDDFGRLKKASQTQGTGSRSLEYVYVLNPQSKEELEQAETDEMTLLASMSDYEGHPTNYTYETFTYDESPTERVLRVKKVDESGDETSFTYDERLPIIDIGNQVIVDQGKTFTTTVNDPIGASILFTLDKRGRVVKKQTPSSSGELTESTVWLNNDALVESHTDAGGVTTAFTYDAHGNKLTEKVGELPDITYTYVEPFEVPSSNGMPVVKNRVASMTDRNGNLTSYIYDELGNLTNIDYPENVSEQFTYAVNGDLTSKKDRNNNTIKYGYDAYGYKISESYPDASYKFEWSVDGNLIKRFDGNSNQYTYTYAQGFVWKTEEIGPAGWKQEFTYDNKGNVVSFTDENGRVTTFAYDHASRQLSENTLFNNVPISKNKTWDGNGNLLSEEDWPGEGGTPKTIYTYDLANRLTQINKDHDVHEVRTLNASGTLASTDDGRLVTSYSAYNDLHLPGVKNYSGVGLSESFSYDDNGNLISKTRMDGQIETYDYDGLNRRTSIHEPLNKTTSFTYDGNGNVVTQIDALGYITTNTYDSLNRLTSSSRDIGKGLKLNTDKSYDGNGNVIKETDPRGFTTTNVYDALNRLLSSTREGAVSSFSNYTFSGKPQNETTPNGNSIAYTYDSFDQLTSVTDSLGVVSSQTNDARGNVVSFFDANGNETSMEYDLLNRKTKETLPNIMVTSFTYDVQSNVTMQEEVGDFGTNTTTFTYDELSRLTSTKDTLGREVKRTYHPSGKVEKITDARTFETTFTYNALQQLTTKTDPIGISSYTYDLLDNLISETDRKDIKNSYEVDALGQRWSVKRANIPIEQNKYDEAGNLVSTTDANGNITTFDYDARNAMLAERAPMAAVTDFTNDISGNPIRVIDPKGTVTTYTYDKRNRKLSQTVNNQLTTTFGYDGNGNQISLEDPNGNGTAFDYDEMDNLISIIDNGIETASYAYDDHNNMTSHKDGLKQETTYVYDERGRKISKHYPVSGSEGYDYDANDNLKTFTDANGNVISFNYDGINRETSRTYQSTSTLGISSVSFGLDDNGNLTSISETLLGGKTLSSIRTYDNFDRLKSIVDTFGKSIKYNYDNNGNRILVEFPDGLGKTVYNFDALNRVTSVANTDGVTTYQYEKNSLLKGIAYPNGSSASYSYDGANRLASLTNKINGSVISSFVYTHDNNGNVLTKVEKNGDAQTTTSYEYDAFDRLTYVSYPALYQTGVLVNEAFDATYTYDDAYNRLTEREEASSGLRKFLSYTYNDRNQLADISDTVNPAIENATFNYDANGNQIEKTKAGETTTFVFDARNHLMRITTGGSTIGQFLYDWQGNRIEKIGERGVERSTWDQNSVLMQHNQNGEPLATFNYGPNKLLSITEYP